MHWEDPDKLLRFKFGREEYCQRMLTSLILAGPYPKWNSRNQVSVRGKAFLQALYTRAYGTELDTRFEFVDEFNLPSVDEDTKDGAPDYAVISPDRLWVIELKTEAKSHRKGQMPYYERLAKHHYPDKYLDMLYLTSDMQRQDPTCYSKSTYAHLYWSEILDFIAETWSSSEHREERELSKALVRELVNLERPTKTFTEEAAIIRDAIRLAKDVQTDGNQRAVDVTAGGLQELIDTRKRIADALARDIATPNVRPWIWYEATSGGKPLTELGRSVGCELRLSRYKKNVQREC